MISDTSSHGISGFFGDFLIKYKQMGGDRDGLDHGNTKSDRLY
jgi:hypothetical protein